MDVRHWEKADRVGESRKEKKIRTENLSCTNVRCCCKGQPPASLYQFSFAQVFLKRHLVCVCSQQKLKQDIARQKSCLEATREMVTRFTEAADSATASALQGKLAEVTEHFSRLCQQQQEKEEALKGLLPKVEQYEQLSEKLQQFTESRARMLASGNQPDRDIARFSQHIQVRCGSPA